MSKTLQHLIAATLLALGLFASTAQAQVVIATDDFSADTVSIDNRLRLENTTDDWVAFPDTLWTVAIEPRQHNEFVKTLSQRIWANGCIAL